MGVDMDRSACTSRIRQAAVGLSAHQVVAAFLVAAIGLVFGACGSGVPASPAGAPASTASSTPGSTAGLPSTTPPTSGGTTTTDTISVGEDATAEVLQVIDGDTLVVRIMDGSVTDTDAGAEEEVRLIGIDAPEPGEPFAAEATASLKDLVTARADARVAIVLDEEARDQYGRLLAYVFCGDRMDVFANAELLRSGVATLYMVRPNVLYESELRQAQDEAKAAGRGVWRAAPARPVTIAGIKYDPPGDDTQDLNQEYVVFQVLVTSGSLRGYAVEDESGKRFDFPDRVFQTGQTITLHSGRKAPTPPPTCTGERAAQPSGTTAATPSRCSTRTATSSASLPTER